MPTPDVVQATSLILVRKAFHKKSAQRTHWAALTAIIVVVVFMWLTLRILTPEDVTPWQHLHKVLEALRENPGKLLELFGVLVLLTAESLAIYVQTKDKIIVNADGISYRTSIPSWLPVIASSWNLPWNRIRKAEIRLVMGQLQPILYLNDAVYSRKILIDAWVNEKDKSRAKSSFKDIFRYERIQRAATFDEMKARVEASPLVQSLRTHNIAINYPNMSNVGLTFDLKSSARTIIAIAVIMVLLAYAFIDFLYIDEIYVDDYPWIIWTGVGLVTIVLAYRIIKDSKIPKAVSTGLAVLIGMAMSVALYPGLLRLNQVTDSQGPKAYEYVLREYIHLVPMNNDLPEVTLNRYRDYWDQFPLGSSHQLYLRRGALGFYQLNVAPLLDAVRAYHDQKIAEQRKTRKP